MAQALHHFYEKQLGFDVVMTMPAGDYAIVERDAAREIDDGDAMSGSGVARERAAAPRLGIVGMAADADDAQAVFWGGGCADSPACESPGTASSEAPRNSRRERCLSPMRDSGTPP